MVRFLRTFNIIMPEDYGGDYHFENEYYVPVEKRMFRDIRIEILNQSGKRVPFTDGKTTFEGGPSFSAIHYTSIYKHDIDTPPTDIYKYGAVRTVLYTPSGVVEEGVA